MSDVTVTKYGYFGASNTVVKGRVVRRTKTQVVVRMPGGGDLRFLRAGNWFEIKTGDGMWRRTLYAFEASQLADAP